MAIGLMGRTLVFRPVPKDGLSQFQERCVQDATRPARLAQARQTGALFVTILCTCSIQKTKIHSALIAVSMASPRSAGNVINANHPALAALK